MKKMWLDLRAYRLHLMLARDYRGAGAHTLVVTGPSVGQHREELTALGFAHDERMAHREFWVRPLQDMTLGAIQRVFTRAELVEMPVENIMPAMRAIRSRAKASKAATNVGERTNVTQLGASPGLSGNADRNTDAARAGRDALLGTDDQRATAPGASAAVTAAAAAGASQELSAGTARGAVPGSPATGAPVETGSPAEPGSQSPGARELAEPRQDGRPGNADLGAGTEPGAVTGRSDQASELTPGEPPQDGAATEESIAERQPFIHQGVHIYPFTSLRDGQPWHCWATQTRENIGTDKTFGDTLHATREEAIAQADRDYQLEQERIADRARIAQEAEAAEQARQARLADDVNGFITAEHAPNQAELIRKNLEKPVRINGVVATLREHLDGWHTAQKLEVSTYEEWRIKDMSRTAFNRATNEQQRAHAERQRAGGKKTVYLVNNYDLGKTAHDYAAHLLAMTADALESVAPQTVESSSEETATESIIAEDAGHTALPVDEDATVEAPADPADITTTASDSSAAEEPAPTEWSYLSPLEYRDVEWVRIGTPSQGVQHQARVTPEGQASMTYGEIIDHGADRIVDRFETSDETRHEKLLAAKKHEMHRINERLVADGWLQPFPNVTPATGEEEVTQSVAATDQQSPAAAANYGGDTAVEQPPFVPMRTVVRFKANPDAELFHSVFLGYVATVEPAGARGWRVELISPEQTDTQAFFYTDQGEFEDVGVMDSGQLRWHEGYDPDELAEQSRHARMQRWIAVAADSVEQLRSSDVFRVLQDRQSADSLKALADYLIEQREDLRDEVRECVDDIVAENQWQHPYPPQEPVAADEVAGEPENGGAMPTEGQAEEASNDAVPASAQEEPAREAIVDLDDGSDSDGYATDRIWRGLTVKSLRAAEADEANSTYWQPSTAFHRLKKAEEEGLDQLSQSERVGLMRFMGWGGVHGDVRADNARANRNYQGERIADYLGMESGRFTEVMLDNRLESYYTPGSTIEEVWNMVLRAGVSPGGRFMEPGCGAARFFVGAPEEVQSHGTLVGIERDPIAARMARVVAPDAVIINAPFEEAVLDRGFDAVIGNVPFGETRIFDSRYPDAKHIHDYFIIRSLDHLKPGGVMAVMTSSGTMDKRDPGVRQQMMERADLVAAFRLPEEVFAAQGASVTTDILFLQKRPPGTKPSFDYTGTDKVSLEFRDEPIDIEINSYFVDHPEHILGTLTVASSAFGPRMQVTGLRDVSGQLRAAAEAIPEGIAQRTDWELDEEQSVSVQQNPSFEYEDTGTYLDDYDGFVGDMFVDGDDIHEVVDLVDTFDEAGVRDGRRFITLKLDLPAKASAVIKAYIPLRDAARQLMHAQLDSDDARLEAAQALTKEHYDQFVEQFGPVNGAVRRYFGDDPGCAEVCALELWDDEESKVEQLADVLFKRVLGTESAPVIDNAVDAYYASFDRFGTVDLDYMAEISGIDQEQIIEELNGDLIFRDHLTGEWVPSQEYLNGNVVKRLAEVEQALLTDMSYKINFDALQRVQPTPIPFGDIHITLGCNWIPPHEIRGFVSHLVGSDLGEDKLTIRYSDMTNQWTVDASNAFKRDFVVHRTSLFGTERANMETLLEKLMNSQRPSHYVEVDGKKILDVEATNASRQKQEDLAEAFQQWLASDLERADRFTELYNKAVNVIRVSRADGSRISFPGLAPNWIPRDHQRDKVAQAMLGFNTLADHPVGSGKTFEIVATAMKLKQIGHHNKPAIAVPNHMLGQIAREAKQMYPAARILMVERGDLSGANRRRFMAIARNNDWDLIVCTHSMMNQIQAPLDIRLKKIEDRIDATMAAIASTDNKRQQRTLEARKKTLESQVAQMRKDYDKLKTSDSIVTLDMLGIDALLVDEVHLYKNLELHSSLNVLGVTTSGSKRASNFEDLCEYLRTIHGRSSGVHTFTGTSIANSMCELYVHNRILRPEILEEVGINNFDEWAKRFGEVVSNLEALPEGGGFRVNERFAKFINLPEMLRLFHTFTDVRTHAQLNLPKPTVHTEIVVSDQTEWQKAFMNHLSRRAKAVRNRQVKPDEDNMLSISTAGRKAALDMRLVDELIPDEATLKLQTVANNTYKQWEANSEVKGTQLVFIDMGTPGKHKSYSTYERLKELMVQAGIPAEEIAFMQDNKTDEKKEAVFAAVRAGTIRVLMGSTESMGVGTNVQERLCALHDVDCPWRPADIEQRLGRIARQGNLYFDEVTNYRYTTKDSFDLFMWETNKRKATFIEQAKADPDSADREVSEETDMGYAAVMAVTTGEPRIKEKVEVDEQVSRLERRQRSWWNDRIQRASTAKQIEREINTVNVMIARADQVIEALPASRYKCVTVGGSITDMQDGPTTWLYATEVGEAIHSRLPFLEAKLMRMGGTDLYEPLGMSVGKIELGVLLTFDKSSRVVGRLGDEILPLNQVRHSKSAQAMGRGVRAWFDVEHELKPSLLRDKAVAERNLAALGDIEQEDAWPQQEEYDALRERQRELDAWFVAQDFNKEDEGPDPFLTMLQQLRDEQEALSAVIADELEQVGTAPVPAQTGDTTELFPEDLFSDGLLSNNDMTQDENKVENLMLGMR